MDPEGFKLEYSVQRLPEDLLDINGLPVSNDRDYRVVLYIIAEGDRQLSQFSRAIPLKDQGVYAGFYSVSGSSGYSTFQHDSTVFVANGNDKYSGILWGLFEGRCGSNDRYNLGSFLLSISDKMIIDLLWNTFHYNGNCPLSDRTSTGHGIITSDIAIQITIEANPDFPNSGLLVLKRQ